jgi:hypothetical protein
MNVRTVAHILNGLALATFLLLNLQNAVKLISSYSVSARKYGKPLNFYASLSVQSKL